jgi:hypothetical protein
MIGRFAVLLVAASVCSAVPAGAEEIGVGVGPVGVTVGSGPDRVVREREVIREREPRVEKKVIIKKDRDHDRDGSRTTVIEHRD